MKPIVSIIIPVYNKKEYILDCISALLNQEYKKYEIIIVDDGSTDGSSELLDIIAQDNKEKNIKVYHQKNQGVSVARNQGMSLAKGEWIWFVDADDVPNRLWLSKIREYFEDGAYDIICSDYMKIFPNHKEEAKTFIQGEVEKEKFPSIFMELQYQTGYFGYLWCKLLRKTFIEKNHVSFMPGLVLAEDLKFLVALYEKEPSIFFTDDQAYKYTIDANNSSKEKKIDYQAQLEIHYDIYQWIKNTRYYEKYERELKKHISYYVAFVFFYGFENNQILNCEFKWWKENQKYEMCLESKNMKGTMKWLVFLLQRKMYFLMESVLKVRWMLRHLYRRGKGI